MPTYNRTKRESDKKWNTPANMHRGQKRQLKNKMPNQQLVHKKNEVHLVRVFTWSRRKKLCWLALMTVVAGSKSVQSTRGPSVLKGKEHYDMILHYMIRPDLPVRYYIIWYGTIWQYTVRYYIRWHDTIRCDMILYHTWYDIIWYLTLRYDVRPVFVRRAVHIRPYGGHVT